MPARMSKFIDTQRPNAPMTTSSRLELSTSARGLMRSRHSTRPTVDSARTAVKAVRIVWARASGSRWSQQKRNIAVTRPMRRTTAATATNAITCSTSPNWALSTRWV
jgi:hypothetical protein